MPTEAKVAAVAALKEDLAAAKATIVADYRGLTVSEIGAVRRALRGEGITYRVVKNRLAKIAAHEVGNDALTELLEGPSALAMGGGDEVTLARAFLDAIRPYRTVAIRGAVLNGQRVDADSVTRLATLPSREVLLAQLAGGMASPMTTMASLLAAPLRNLGYALSQLMERKGQQAEPAAPEAPAAKAAAAPGAAAAPEAEAAEASAATPVEAEAAAAEPAQVEVAAEEATPQTEETEAPAVEEAAEPEATDSEPEATDTEPEATDTEPEATDTEPEATDTEPEATDTEPEATDTEPEATDTEPEATDTEPEATDTEPEPASTDADESETRPA